MDEHKIQIRVTAPDGIEIVGASAGAGPGLALVYGALMDRRGWARLLPQLQTGRTVYTYDRRGRGESGDGARYAVEREADDLLAFLRVLPQPLDLFGHSSGALLALHAALRGAAIRRLVLYEPTLLRISDPAKAEELPRLVDEAMLNDDRERALELFLTDGMGQSAEGLARLRKEPRWRELLSFAKTVAYDLRITRSFAFEPARLASLETPTLVLVGERSPPWMHRACELLTDALADARLGVIEGQGHNAQFSAPEVLADKIRSFLG